MNSLPETSRILAIKGAQFILVPAWGDYSEMNDMMMRTRANENSVFVAFVHPKRCLFINPKGRVIAKDSGDTDQIVHDVIHFDVVLHFGVVPTELIEKLFEPKVFDVPEECLFRDRHV